MLSKTDRLIQQQIARYFSRLSAVTKIGLLMRSPSVNMNEDGEADANDLASEFETDRTRQKIRRDLAKFRQKLQERVQLLLSLKKKHLHLTFLSHLLSLLTKTTGYVLGFHQGRFAGSLLVKLLLAHSYFKILQVTQLNPATLDLERCGFICSNRMLEKNMQIFYNRSRQIIIEICRLF